MFQAAPGAAIAATIVACLAGIGAAANLDLTLLSNTIPAAKGGRCMDGSMTGYYYRKGRARYVCHLDARRRRVLQ